jgi:hypothetical protein
MNNTPGMEFALTGYGQLRDVEQIDGDGQWVAHIGVLPVTIDSQDASPDTVTLVCEIPDKALRQQLLRLVQQRDGRGLTLQFEVVYTRFKACYAEPSGPVESQLILIQGTLVAMKRWFWDSIYISTASMNGFKQSIKNSLKEIC